jgi:hypothetical protein
MYSQNGTIISFCRDSHHSACRKKIISFSRAKVIDYTREYYLNGPASTAG